MQIPASTASPRRKDIVTMVTLTVILWMAALLLWSAHDLTSPAPLSSGLRRLLIETFLLGITLSGLLAVFVAVTRRITRLPRVMLVAAAALGIAMLHGWIDAHQIVRLQMAGGQRTIPIFDIFTMGLMPFVLIYGLYATGLSLMFSAMTIRDSERRLAEARDAAQQAQLAALRFQLNPHFLFNTLNAISSLIVTARNDEAEEMMGRLCEFLRASLEADPESEVTLDEELATTQSYLDIETVRFGDRLNVAFECPTALLDASVPSFLLQPIVENAVKYAVAPSRRPVTVTIRVTAGFGGLRLSVEDDGRQASGPVPTGGTGLGLANVRKRLATFYGADAGLDAMTTERGFIVTIALPLRQRRTLLAAE